jgi:hypothetical protein
MGKISIFLLLIVFLMPFMANAQDSEGVREINKIRQYFSGSGLMHMKGEMTLKQLNTGGIIDNLEFETWVQGSRVLSKISFIELLKNDSVYVMVNHKTKTIYAKTVDKASRKKFDSQVTDGQVLQLLHSDGAKVTVTKLKDEGIIQISGAENSKFSLVKVRYSLNDYKVKQVEALVRPDFEEGPQNQLNIHYAVIEKSISNQEVFSSAPFIAKIKGKIITVSSKFKDYRKF